MRLRCLFVMLLACACAGSSANRPPPTAKPKPEPATPAPAPEPAPASSPAPASPEPSADGSLPDTLELGPIARATLTGVLASGIGRFLQRVRTEPDFDSKGRFAGWRIVSFAEGDATLRSSVLRPGDTVLRVNGQPIERPEQFKDVWDSLATSTELVLQVRRAGKPSELHYRIVD